MDPVARLGTTTKQPKKAPMRTQITSFQLRLYCAHLDTAATNCHGPLSPALSPSPAFVRLRRGKEGEREMATASRGGRLHSLPGAAQSPRVERRASSVEGRGRGRGRAIISQALLIALALFAASAMARATS